MYIVKQGETEAETKKRAFAQTVAESVALFLLSLSALPGGGPVRQGLTRVFDWLLSELGLQVTQLLIAGFVAIAGITAYWFKRKNQKWYGMVEIGVGVLSAVFVAGTLTPHKLDLARWSTLAGSAYVIARGLENRAKGMELLKLKVVLENPESSSSPQNPQQPQSAPSS